MLLLLARSEGELATALEMNLPNKLTISIPKDYADLSPTIVDAAFRSDQGQLAIRIDMTALIPPARINEILGGLVKSLKKP